MSELSEMIRKNFKEGDDQRDEGLTAPEDIRRFDDIAYGGDTKRQLLDVYRPKASEGMLLPVIVSVHGGAWVYGDKERYQYYCMSLAQNGFAVVNFTYRLAPEYKFPSQLEDTNSVFAWVLEHAEQYGFDTRYVFAVGDSAGAHLLSLYSAICTNEEYAKNYDFRIPEGFVPTAVALNCGVYNMDDEKKREEVTSSIMADLLPEQGTPEELKLVSPERYVTDRFPPTYLMTASGDFLKKHALYMAECLTEREVEFEYHFYGNSEKVLGHVFHVNMKLKEAAECNKEECGFFRKYMKE